MQNASWGRLATEFVAAKDNPSDLQVFINCSLAQGWEETGAALDDLTVAARAKDFSLEAIPRDVLLITAGCDIQGDRAEVTLCGWDAKGAIYILDHAVLWGSPHDQALWRDLSDLLASQWRHPLGGRIGISAACVDSGDGNTTDQVYKFCAPRAKNNVMASKGVDGPRPVIEASKGKVAGGNRLFILGVDGIKSQLFDKITRDQAIHFSDTLTPVFYEQLCCSERFVTRYFKGRPIRRFEPISGRRNERLDCTVMAIGARAVLRPNFAAVEDRLKGVVREHRSIVDQLPR